MCVPAGASHAVGEARGLPGKAVVQYSSRLVGSRPGEWVYNHFAPHPSLAHERGGQTHAKRELMCPTGEADLPRVVRFALGALQVLPGCYRRFSGDEL